jgi:hypothetical protein
MSLEGFVNIDANTVRGLQLLHSSNCRGKKLSLFEILNNCQTLMGGNIATSFILLFIFMKRECYDQICSNLQIISKLFNIALIQ